MINTTGHVTVHQDSSEDSAKTVSIKQCAFFGERETVRQMKRMAALWNIEVWMCNEATC